MIGDKFTSRHGFETSGSTILRDTKISGSITDSFGNTGSVGEAVGSVSGSVVWVDKIESSSLTPTASHANGIHFAEALPLVYSREGVASLPNNSAFFSLFNDSFVDHSAYDVGGFSGISDLSSTVSDVTAFLRDNSATFTATVNSVFSTSYGIGRAFSEGLDHAVLEQSLNGLLLLTNWRDIQEYQPNGLNFRGRASNDYWQNASWIATYTDGTTETATSTTTSNAEYHGFLFNADGTKVIDNIRIDTWNQVGIHPGFRDFNVFFPQRRVPGLYKKINGVIKIVKAQ